MRLSNFTQSRDNNFNLIRLLAALAVLVSHSFNLATGLPDAEPLVKSLGVSPASIAVDVFFITSGFLVTASLLARRNAIEFFWARVLRIFPALLVMVLLTVFGLGLLFTSLPLSSYLLDPHVYRYMIKNAILFTGVVFDLPGVFEGNPFKSVVNGALWTLPAELQMYAILAVLWFISRGNSESGGKMFRVVIVSCAFVAGTLRIAGGSDSSSAADQFTGLFFMFFCGAAFYVLRRYVVLSKRLFWAAAAALALASAEKQVFVVVYGLAAAYMLLFLAYIPAGRIRAFNRVGDYSYGLYIYAFPVQQSIAALVPGISVWALAASATIVSMFFAGLSWHFLEQYALRLKNYYAGSARSPLAAHLTNARDQTR